ncbi:hypothetical protein J5X84_19905 [Streptosporangiaceae bacterium NEAU-GS5]|nr:hypothetical protein [Streptosporangiaceae bacterium NEAU-GS5]
MSEYQYYEFAAIDRPLTEQEQAEVRALSTWAQITATGFVDEYESGDFKGDPGSLMERFYDVHLYCSGWGTRRIMLRLPQALLDPELVEQYDVDDHVTFWTAQDHVIIELTSDEEGEHGDRDKDLPAIAGIRAELAAGDLRPLYLAWLSAYGSWERDEDAFDYADEEELEPPVPAGLGALTPSQQALARFLRLDAALLDVAAQVSAARGSQADLGTWLSRLDAARKDALLARVAEGFGDQVRLELLRGLRDSADVPAEPTRTVAELLDAAAARRHALARAN